MRCPPKSNVLRWVLVGALVVLGCKDLIGGGTSFLTRITFDESLGIQQLRFRGFDGTTQIFGPTRRPDTPTTPIHGVQTVRIQFPNSLSGKTVEVMVEGILEEQIVAQGSGSGMVHKGKEVDVLVQLQATDAGMPDAGCNNCLGCCSNGNCFAGNSRDSCGVDGGTCTACDHLVTDRCTNGMCRCGDGGVCAAGLECDAGTCQCTANSCVGCCRSKDGGASCETVESQDLCGVAGKPCAACATQCDAGVCAGQCDCQQGCCSGTTCYDGGTRYACGSGGIACSVCFPQQSDCVGQTCQCGSDPPCGWGQYCNRTIDRDYCACSPSSCPFGCCVAPDRIYCSLGSYHDFCGRGGQDCQQCDIDQECRGQTCQFLRSSL